MYTPSLFLLGLVTAANAHTTFSRLWINDVSQGSGTCIRMDPNGMTGTGPIRTSLESSPEMACGRDGQESVAFTCPAPAGAKLTFEYREYADLSQPGALDAQHKGPAAFYVKQVTNMKSDSAAGDGWFKIWEEGYDSATGLWATEKMMHNNGLMSFNVPEGLPTGYYLFRSELLTFQNVTNNYVDPQFYVGCAQIFVQGSSSGPLTIPADKKVSIPGHVQLDQKELHFNIYDQPLKLPYNTPGPKPFIPAGSGSGSGQTKVAQTQGAIPNTCLAKNANWCGFEVPSYTTQDGCWAASKNCFEQQEACYKAAPPTGHAGCDMWNKEKCEPLVVACNGGQWTGPPNKGVKLGDPTAQNGEIVNIPDAAPGPAPEDGGDAEKPAPSPTAGTPDVVNAPAVSSPTPVEGGAESGGNDAAPLPSSVFLSLPPANAPAIPTTFSFVAKPSLTPDCTGRKIVKVVKVVKVVPGAGVRSSYKQRRGQQESHQ
ncbi:glycosyl hydrolase family 61-domain-containing protein [Apodospora peruviana]|uniref:lytic cellulose monooxygenase (C4-dehydrogenating) n=1 Tax=Apodospora peruviana TaxID=516989 RepID=A0AAE0M410_9PEZI|nr:glycosyl hydrolase family 61-domain-containing protein [Apodospora peruviana]